MIHECFIAVRILTKIFFRKAFTAKFVALFVADGVEFSTGFLQISSVVLPNRTFPAIDTLCFRTLFSSR